MDVTFLICIRVLGIRQERDSLKTQQLQLLFVDRRRAGDGG